MPLLIKPSLANDESLRAYVSRLATRNLSPSLFRPMMDSLFTLTSAIPEIAELAGEEAVTLLRRGSAVKAEGRQEGGIRFGDVILPRQFIRGPIRAVCPKCIARGDVSRCVWELCQYDVCDRHGLRLVDTCSACRRPLSWLQLSADQCACGFHLAQLEAKTGSVERRRLCRILANSMHRTIHSGSVTGEFRNARAISIDWTLLLFEFVGEVLIPRFGERHGLSSQRLLGMARAELTASILEDSVYRDYLRDAVFMYASADPMTLVSKLRPGMLNAWRLCRHETCWDELSFHQSLWNFKQYINDRKFRRAGKKRIHKQINRANQESLKHPTAANCEAQEIERHLFCEKLTSNLVEAV